MPGIPPGPLFAAGIDWLESLLPLLFLVFWIVSQVVGVIRKVAGGGQAPQPVPRPPRPRPEVGGDVRVELERQIEEFLERSRSGPQPRPVAERPERPQVKPRPRPPAPAKQLPSPAPAPRAAVAGGRPLGSLAGSGGDVASHVHDAFAHEIGHLASPLAGAESPAAVSTARAGAGLASAAELTAALRSPATVRQLMLLKEVLERPVDRW